MKKECSNCAYFSDFYTKIGFSFIQTACGRCWQVKTIVDRDNYCNRWEAVKINEAVERSNIISALEKAVTQIDAIKEALSK